MNIVLFLGISFSMSLLAQIIENQTPFSLSESRAHRIVSGQSEATRNSNARWLVNRLATTQTPEEFDDIYRNLRTSPLAGWRIPPRTLQNSIIRSSELYYVRNEGDNAARILAMLAQAHSKRKFLAIIRGLRNAYGHQSRCETNLPRNRALRRFHLCRDQSVVYTMNNHQTELDMCLRDRSAMRLESPSSDLSTRSRAVDIRFCSSVIAEQGYFIAPSEPHEQIDDSSRSAERPGSYSASPSSSPSTQGQ